MVRYKPIVDASVKGRQGQKRHDPIKGIVYLIENRYSLDQTEGYEIEEKNKAYDL
jgi:hypothetical protein